MNIQAINLKSTRRRRQAAARAVVADRIYLVGGLLLFFGIIALSLNYRTWLNKNIAQVDKQTQAYRKKIHELDRELENLRLHKESLSNWPHIRARIAALQLNLRLPQPAQLQHLAVNFDETPAAKPEADVAARRMAMALSGK
ncbi:MAG: hypothetical protein PHH77_08635 [Victivallaceae bacterium]|nr:hypothetical protein [Victivallaceae bacterium]